MRAERMGAACGCACIATGGHSACGGGGQPNQHLNQLITLMRNPVVAEGRSG